MCEATTIGLIITAASTVAQGYQARQKGKFDRGVADYNARQLENEAIKTQNLAAEQENKQRQETAQLISRQRAQLGAANVDLSSGSALQLQTDASLFGDVDALRIRSNIGDQAISLQQQAGLTQLQGQYAEQAGNNAFTGSLLSAAGSVGGSVASKWYTSNSAAVTGSLNLPDIVAVS